MLAVAIFEETEETTDCAGIRCPEKVKVDDDNYSNGIAYCGRWIGDDGYFCDDCFPRCYCQDCDSDGYWS
jgi:hypothetical protein